MTVQQIAILCVLVVTAGLFIWGRWRHDIVALAALIVSVALGLVAPGMAFTGFGNPAVITVACVLILSYGLQTTGVMDQLASKLLPSAAGLTVSVTSLCAVAAVLSAFMNNIGALALLMPIALKTARRLGVPPGRLLMPVSFASILGGMITLTGTPPNLIVSGFRDQTASGSFAMFDFAPVGLAVTLGGLALILLGGWRLVPSRERSAVASFETAPYIIEAVVTDESKLPGQSLRVIEQSLEAVDAQVVGLIRGGRRISAPSPYREIHKGDVLVIEADPDSIGDALSTLGLSLPSSVKVQETEKELPRTVTEGAVDSAGTKDKKDPDETRLQSGDVVLMELAVRPNASLVGLSVKRIDMRNRFGVNLIALSRDGKDSMTRLNATPIRSGDVLLVQGTDESILEFANVYGCIPLAERSLKIPDRKKAWLAAAIMMVAVAGAAFGLLPAAVTFSAGVVAVAVFKIVPPRKLYEPIDWTVIVLLGALIPVAEAMSTTGAADVLARTLIETIAQNDPVITLAILMIVTMTLSDFMNNAATAAVMCPIALGASAQLQVSPDAYLMAVAVGASCAFLTPIGHQNNTLILGPGGFRFGDYWRLGLPLELSVIVIGVPMLLWVWPL